MQYCSLQHRTLLLSPVISTTGYCFCFGSIPAFFLELFLHWSPVAYWAPNDLGSSSFSFLSFCLFILFMGFSRQEHIQVRGSGTEWQAAMAKERPRGATPCPRPGAAAWRSYPMPEVRGGGREGQPHIQGAVAVPAQEGWEELLHVQGQEGGGEEIPLVQGKEQQLRFAGAAVKRYPTSKLRETQVRRYVLQEGIRGQTHWNHNHRKLVNLIIWTTALSNSMKLSHTVWGHPRWAGHGGGVWQNVIHWRRELQTTSVFLPW